MRIFFLPLFLLLLTSCLLPLPAQAAGIGVSVKPFLSDLVFEEGESEKAFTITLSNDSDADMRFAAFPVDFGSLDASAGVAFLGAARDIEQSYTRASWIALDADTVSVPARGTAELHGRLVNTAELAPGGHYGSILFDAGDPGALRNGPANVALEQRISALVFVKKRGGERSGMELVRSGRERDLFGMARSMALVFRSTGNVHIIPRGRVDLIDPLGRLVALGIVNEDSSIVLPQSEREMVVRMRGAETAWVPGYYTLRMGYRYDDQSTFETREERVFVVPMAFFGLVVVFLVALFAGNAFMRRRRNKN